jgi:hypothetical protein
MAYRNVLELPSCRSFSSILIELQVTSRTSGMLTPWTVFNKDRHSRMFPAVIAAPTPEMIVVFLPPVIPTREDHFCLSPSCKRVYLAKALNPIIRRI